MAISTGLDSRQWQFIRSNLTDVRDLPEPGTEWIARDVWEDRHSRAYPIIPLTNAGLITCVGKTSPEGANANVIVNVYRTDPRAYDYVQRVLEEEEPAGDPTCPECGLRAFTNEGNGTLACKACGATNPKGEWL